MDRKLILILAALVMAILGVYMIYLGSKSGIRPPVITGIGFIVIAIVFLGIRNNK